MTEQNDFPALDALLKSLGVIPDDTLSLDDVHVTRGDGAEIASERPESGIPALDAAIERIPFTNLPSVSTRRYLLDEAMDSDDIDEVKSKLVHVWLHYQSLEFALASYDFNAKASREGIEEHRLTGLATSDETRDEVYAQVYGTNLILASYNASHEAGELAATKGLDPVDTLETIYGHLKGGE